MDTSGIKVLLVDDDEEEYLLARRHLSKARSGPFTVTWASTFDDALRELRGAEHDICLLDYELGEHTGIELLTEMRAQQHDLPVILLTGHGSLEIDLTAMELGAFDYMEKKDITPSLLERSIRYTVTAHRARAALRKSNEDLERRVQERTAELNRSNQELEQFAEMVASDLREPLANLVRRIEAREKADAAKASDAGSAAIQRERGFVLHAIRNMELLMETVLDYAQAGRGARTLGLVDLNAAFNDARTDLAGAIAESHAQIEIEPLPTVRGDHGLIRGLFRNLIDNGIKFCGSGPPHIRVWSESKGDAWLIAIADNGVGIEPERISDLFVMFQGEGQDSPGAGVGIGLAICRKIIQYYGGRIWVDSEPGAGSTFYVAFPAR